MQKIPLSEVEFSKFSLCDSFGKVFTWNGKLYRGIFKESKELALELFSSGLTEKLQQEKLIPPTKVTNLTLDGFNFVIEHELIHPVSYPHEWSFSMLKDAAMCILKVNKIALTYGFETKDCHAYNVLFYDNNPMFIDIGSFVKCSATRQLLCYKEFLSVYYYPLKIWASNDYYTAKRIISDEASVLPHKSYFNIRYGFILRKLGYYVQKIRKLRFKLLNTLYKKRKLKGEKREIEYFASKVKQIFPPLRKSYWNNYHNEYLDSSGNVTSTTNRFERIVDLVKNNNISSVTELGGNQGIVSKLILQKIPFVKKVICTDYDENAIDLLYLSIKRNITFNSRMSTAILNFMTPTANYSEIVPEKRFVSECVLALAVTHHLILTQRFNIDNILSTIILYTTQYAIIEFMPLGLWNGTSAPPFPEWYNRDWFIQHLEKYFSILLEEKIEENRIAFFCQILK